MRLPAAIPLRVVSSGSSIRWLLLGTVLGIAAGCAKARPLVDGNPACTSWTEVGPTFATKCASCHSGAQPAGNWDATTYLGAIGVPAPSGSFLTPSTPSGVVVAGDASSRLLAALGPSSTIPEHRISSELIAKVRSWVVDCGLSYNNSKVHRPGLLNPADADFHGNLLKENGWNFGVCTKCHGDDFSGGAAGQSCTQCHKKGPTDCTTCHQDITTDGKHGPHLLGPTLGHPFECSDCHIKPEHWNDPGHILNTDGTPITTPAQVTFGAFANQTPAGSSRSGPASFDPSDKSCSNVYCHGGAYADANAKVPVPKWTDGKDSAACGSCHGIPPSNHGGQQQCTNCHGDVIDANKQLTDLSKHLTGQVYLPTDCNTCHKDIAKDGAHGAHLDGPTLGHKFDCTECHIKPQHWNDPGHIMNADGTPVTTPAKVTFGDLANATPDGSTRAGPATFNPSDKSCSNVYCHAGSFTDSNAKVPVPKWTDGQAAAACGACHGLPPSSHGGAQECTMCHGDIIDANKQLTDLSKHITGQVYLKAGITDPSCTACHGGDAGNAAPPRDLEGNTSTTAMGVGAHQSHLNPTNGLTAPMVCGDCHLVPDNVLSSGHINTGEPPRVFPSDISGTSKAFADGAAPAFDSSTGQCSNTYCHGGGQTFQADHSPGLRRTPTWTDAGKNEVLCGSCHGVPPADASHSPTMNLFDCATCHPGSVDPTGFPIVTGSPGQETSKHINGVIDYVAP